MQQFPDKWSLKKLPKIKSSKTAGKRFIITGSGRIKFGKVGNQHNALSASKRRKSKGSTIEISKTNYRSIKRLLPYGGI